MRFFFSIFSVGFCGLFTSCSSDSMKSVMIDDRNPPTIGVSYALPKGMVELLVESEGSKITVNQPTVKYLPDPQNRFSVQIDENPWYSEKPKITTTTTGLLASVNGESTDAGPAIVESVVNLVTDIGLLASATAQSDSKPPSESKKSKFQTRVVFDPLDPWQVHNATTSLKRSGGHDQVTFQLLKIDGSPLHATQSNHNTLRSQSQRLQDEAKKSSKNCKSSICFRLVTPIILRISVGSTTKQDFSLVVPDPLLVAELDVSRAPCVRTTTAMTFSNGVLTEYEKDLPSSALGCLAIPSAIVKGILGFPQKLADQRAALLDSETKLLTKQAALIDAQQKLIAAQLGTTPTVSPN